MRKHCAERAVDAFMGSPDDDLLRYLDGERLYTTAQWEFKKEGKAPESLADKARRFAGLIRGACAWFRSFNMKFVPGMAWEAFWRRVELIGASAGGVKLPEPKDQDGRHFDSWQARHTDPKWWARQLDKVRRRKRERDAILAGDVRRGKQLYCTDDAVREFRERRAMALHFTKQCVVFNEDADVAFLSELAEKSISNPAIRKAEMFARIRGMEEYATECGHVAVFVTLTCPSRMHPGSGKYDGTTPKAANAYLGEQFGKARAALGRETRKRPKVPFYGMRVAEPHNDGCPHWHALFFMAPEHVPVFKDRVRHYALEVDGAEQGAALHRVTFEDIDPEKGSAVGYLAKYIAKNIDGRKVNGSSVGDVLDADGQADGDAIETAERVLAWASLWGIRQFQQVGGELIGPWRELRRVDQEISTSDILEAARKAADAGDYCEYLRACRLAREAVGCGVCTEKEVRVNRYGEDVRFVVGVGMQDGSAGVVTRRWWCLMRLADVFDAYESAECDAWADLLGQVIYNVNAGGFYGGASAPPLDLCQ